MNRAHYFSIIPAHNDKNHNKTTTKQQHLHTLRHAAAELTDFASSIFTFLLQICFLGDAFNEIRSAIPA